MNPSTLFASLAAAAMAVSCLAADNAAAQRRYPEYRAESWRELDVRRVDPRTDRIVMPVGRNEGRHTAIRLRVLGDSLFIRRLLVTYGNGTQSEIPLRRAMAPGEVTEPIDLEGDRRLVQDVTVFYRPTPGSRGTGRIALIGDIVDGRGGPPRGDDQGRAPLARDIPPGWVLFGVKTADFGGDRDIIAVGREKGRFDKIALRVRDNDVFIRDIKVVYGNGEVQDFPINQQVRASYRTAELRLDKPHHITEIQLTYASANTGRQKAAVEVYGEYSAGWVGETGENRQFNAGWVLLGSQTSTMLKSDNDNFPVGQRMGTFQKVRLTVRNSAVEIRNVTIVYGNGQSETLAIGRTLSKDETSPPFDLGARGRFIQSISVNSKSRLSLRGEGAVEVWAQH